MIENEYTLKEWGVKSQRKLTPHRHNKDIFAASIFSSQ